jgi:hypothetical protein
MNLDDFADYKISTTQDGVWIRHSNCSKKYVERVELPLPLKETNLKWLMVLATNHWQEAHRNEEKG